MAKFILLYGGGSMPESEAEVAAVMKAWETWYGELGEAVLDPGDPFTPVASIASGKDRKAKIGNNPTKIFSEMGVPV